RLGLDARVVAAARARVAPERLQIAELLAQTEAAERAAAEARDDAIGAVTRLTSREAGLATEIGRVRASAAAARAQAIASAERARRGAGARGRRAPARPEARPGAGGALADAGAARGGLRPGLRAARGARPEPDAARRPGAAVAGGPRAGRPRRALDPPLPV